MGAFDYTTNGVTMPAHSCKTASGGVSQTQLNSTQIGLLSQVTYTAGKYDMKTTQSNNEGHWSGSLIWPSLVDTLYCISTRWRQCKLKEHNENANARKMNIKKKNKK